MKPDDRKTLIDLGFPLPVDTTLCPLLPCEAEDSAAETPNAGLAAANAGRSGGGGAGPASALSGADDVPLSSDDESLGDDRIRFVISDADARLPRRATDGAAGFDLVSIDEVLLGAWSRALISTGLKVELQKGTYGRIAPRSGVQVWYYSRRWGYRL